MTATEKDPLVKIEAGDGAADADVADDAPQPLLTRARETLALFWYLGFVAFGGPAAHIGLLRDHLVRVHQFIEEDVFLELFALGASRSPRGRSVAPSCFPMPSGSTDAHAASRPSPSAPFALLLPQARASRAPRAHSA